MTELTTLDRETAEKAALNFLASVAPEDWPEDEWFAIAENWDLNLWTETEGPAIFRHAAMYPVVNGQTVTKISFRV